MPEGTIFRAIEPEVSQATTRTESPAILRLPAVYILTGGRLAGASRNLEAWSLGGQLAESEPAQGVCAKHRDSIAMSLPHAALMPAEDVTSRNLRLRYFMG